MLLHSWFSYFGKKIEEKRIVEDKNGYIGGSPAIERLL